VLPHDALRLFFLLAQRLLDGLEQLRDRDLAFLERRLRACLVLAEHLARQLEKGFAVGIQCHARGGFDRGPHLRFALRQQFGGADALLLLARDSRPRVGQIGAQILGALRGTQRGKEETQYQTQGEGRQRDEYGDERGAVHAMTLPFGDCAPPRASSQLSRSSGASSQPCEYQASARSFSPR